jgi:rhamnogalacturonan endolyase
MRHCKQRLAVPAVLAAVAVLASIQPVSGDVHISQDSQSVYFSNDVISFSLYKVTGHIYSVQFGGRELTASDGQGGFNQTFTQNGYFELGNTYHGIDTYSMRTGPGWVDAIITHTPTTYMPFTLTEHHVLRDGESGIHILDEVHHSAGNGLSYLEQLNYAFLGNPAIFNTHDVAADRTAPMPLPSSVVIGGSNEVASAVSDLQGLNSPYPKRYYTKYDWSAYAKDTTVFGITGNGFGAWMVQPDRESLPGGPMKQFTTVHQTQTDPAVLGTDQSTHYGSKHVETSDNWSKTYAPKFLYFNTGASEAAMRADAEQYATLASHQTFYDSLGISGYTLSTDRSHVIGRVNLPGGVSMEKSMVVLSDNNTDWQRATRGYNYWVPANTDGSFDLSNVRAGTYRISVYKDGQFGEYTQDNVTVGAATTLNIGNQSWNPASAGTKVWQIGHPDRTAGEFKHGDTRDYCGAYNYAADFPTGVNYQIATSKPRDDWNYVQWRSWNGVTTSDWNVKFNLANTTSTGPVSLTVAVADSSAPTNLTIFVNGTSASRTITWDMPDSDQQWNSARRSGNSGFYLLHTFTFSTALLNTGANNIALHLTNSDNIMYDSLRMEIPGFGYAPADFTGDNLVDISDLRIFANHWQLDGGLLQGDTNGDAFIDLQDLQLLAQYWAGTPGNPSLQDAMTSVGLDPALVPEPTSLSLVMLSSAAGLLFRRRRAA